MALAHGDIEPARLSGCVLVAEFDDVPSMVPGLQSINIDSSSKISLVGDYHPTSDFRTITVQRPWIDSFVVFSRSFVDTIQANTDKIFVVVLPDPQTLPLGSHVTFESECTRYAGNGGTQNAMFFVHQTETDEFTADGNGYLDGTTFNSLLCIQTTYSIRQRDNPPPSATFHVVHDEDTKRWAATRVQSLASWLDN